MNPIDKTDIIDKYLQGRMSTDEKNDFERLLSDDSESLDGKQSLKEEMEEQKEIIMAIKACGLKEQLKAKEVSIRKKKKIKKALTIPGGTIGGLFVVAALVMLLVVMPMSNTMVDFSNTYAQNINMDQVRGNSYSPEELTYYEMLRAFEYMGERRWREADSIFNSVEDSRYFISHIHYRIYPFYLRYYGCNIDEYRSLRHYDDNIDEYCKVYTLMGKEQWTQADSVLSAIEMQSSLDSISYWWVRESIIQMSELERWLKRNRYFVRCDPQSRLARAFILMGDMRWHEADSISLELMDEKKQSKDEEMQEIYDQALWLHTMCIMHDGQLLESVKLLRQIAKSDSRYAVQAQEILDDLL